MTTGANYKINQEVNYGKDAAKLFAGTALNSTITSNICNMLPLLKEKKATSVDRLIARLSCTNKAAISKSMKLLIMNIVFIINLSSHAFATEGSKRENTLGEIGRTKLAHLCDTVGLSEQKDNVIKLFNLMSEPWSQWSSKTRWSNDITDDNSPFEISVAYKKDKPMIRFLLEPQQDPLTLESNWKAGLELREKLKTQGADLSRLDLVHHLFAPQSSHPATFSIWYAVVVDAHSTLFKVYLNPQIHGERKAAPIIKEALSKLGLDNAWDFLSTRFEKSSEYPKIPYLSLDLSTGPKARTKIYVANKYLTNVELLGNGCLGYVEGTATKWIKYLSNGAKFFNQMPILSTFGFSSSSIPPVISITLPIRFYVENDDKAYELSRDFISQEQATQLRRIMEDGLICPLNQSRSRLTNVTIKDEGDGCLTVNYYFSPQIYASSDKPLTKD